MDKLTNLLTLDLFGIEVVSFSYIKMRSDIIVTHGLQHASLHKDFVVEALILSVLEMVNYGDFGWVVLQHQLSGYRWHQTPR